MRTIGILILIFLHNLTIGQNCEDYDRNLFHMLPKDFPHKINCLDSLEKKQGWWITFKIEYNPIERPDKLKKRDFVDHYSYGLYKDNFKFGTWNTIKNVHLVYIQRTDKYYYSNDTILITSEFAYKGWNESRIYYNSDSSIINSSSLAQNKTYGICIDCDKKGELNEECIMTYRNHEIKTFPFADFDMEFYLSFLGYNEEKREINKKLEK